MKKSILLILALLICNYVKTTTTLKPSFIFAGETTTVVITSTDAIPEGTTQVDYTGSSTPAPTGKFGTSFAVDGKTITCTGVTIAAADTALALKGDDTAKASYGTIAVKAAQKLSTAAASAKTLNTALDLTLTFETAYADVPVLKAVNTTTINPTGCELDSTKKIVKCKATFTAAGTYYIVSNEVNTTKPIEIHGNYLMMSLSLLAYIFLF